MKKIAIACSGLVCLLVSPVFAAENSDAAMEAAALKAINAATSGTNTGVAKVVMNPKAAIPADTSGVPPLVGNFIVVGDDELSAGIPCFFCAPAPGGGFGLAVTVPIGYIPTSLSTLDYTYAFQDVSVSGVCTLAVALMQGNNVLDVAAFPAAIYPSTWVVTFPRSRPNASGMATAIGSVACNGGMTKVFVRTTVFLQ